MAEKKCKYCAMMIPKEAKICPHCRKTQGWTLPAKLVAGFFILMVIGMAFGTNNNSTTTNEQGRSPKEEALSLVSIKYNWNKTGFGSVMEGTFTINNRSKYDIKDIDIKCTNYSKSETALDTNQRTIYEVVKAKSQKKFGKINMGFIHSQAASTSCEIKDFKLN